MPAHNAARHVPMWTCDHVPMEGPHTSPRAMCPCAHVPMWTCAHVPMASERPRGLCDLPSFYALAKNIMFTCSHDHMVA
jgi:hypothetical protein